MLRSRRIVVLALVGVAFRVSLSRAAGPPAYRVVVNPSNPQTAIDRRTLADVFLKKSTRWPTGDAIHPVDQRVDSLVRQRFSEEVLGRSISAVKSYWAQAVFSGRDVPPPELDDDEQVLGYVLRHGGAVGYVSPGANVDRVKVLNVR
jgi:ABC-type phosphate transport system substrate-binding protein